MNRLRVSTIHHLIPRYSLSWCVLRGLSSRKSQDCYTTLGVNYKADQKEIKENFYSLSKKYHPDLNQDDQSALKKFKEVVEAYEILSNPEKRSEYDSKMGFSPRSPKDPNDQNVSAPSSGPNRRRFSGMKGEFRNGRFVDDEAPPEMRNIQYDLSPERMEKIWKRYKTRWDRVEEVEKWKKLEEKKIEFRKRIDQKRKEMNENKMTKEEKAEFMHKIRLHRIDAVEGFAPEENIEDKTAEGRNEFENKKSKLDEHDKAENNNDETKTEETKTNKTKNKEQSNVDEEFDKNTREILKKHFGLSDRELDRLEIGATKRKSEPGYGLNEHDPLYQGLNTAGDAIDWRDYMKKSYEKNKTSWQKMKNSRMESAVNSSRYNIKKQKEDHYGTKIVFMILISALVLGYREFSFERKDDS